MAWEMPYTNHFMYTIWSDIKKWFAGLFHVAQQPMPRASQIASTTPAAVPKTPVAATLPVSTTTMPTTQPSANPDALPVYFDTPEKAFHAVRVLADLAGASEDEKDTLCAVIYQESGFSNEAKNENKNSAGTTLSTDWGMCQVNDFYHVRPTGSPFASVAYVLENPEEVVKWMIGMMLAGGLKQWVAYTSGAYKQWLPKTSAMWQLDVNNPLPTQQ